MQTKMIYTKAPLYGLLMLPMIALAGCGSDAGQEPAAKALPDSVPAPAAATSGGHDHSADSEKLASFFPGSTLSRKPLSLAGDAATHLSKDIGMKFAGGEKDWEVYDASKDGKRVGMVMLTQATLSDGKSMHLAFAVSPGFKVSGTKAIEPAAEGFDDFVKQFNGKDFRDPLTVGKDLKKNAYSAGDAQVVADTIRRGSWIFNEYFNPKGAALAHEGGHSHGAGGHSHDESKPHSHEGESHDESKPHTHEEEPHDEGKPHTH